MSQAEQPIYLVWNPNGTNPKCRHDSVESARAEAKRLSEANPNQEFFVLRAVESVEYRTNPFICKNYYAKRSNKGNNI